MQKSNNVTVLLSSYNGERYIEEQLSSILNQRDVNIQLIVRDDGSSDNTVEILKILAGENTKIQIICGENIGAAQSFFELLKIANTEKNAATYYAFADQDDVWNPNKLSNALAALNKYSADRLLMYFSAVEYVDDQLHHIGFSTIYASNKIGFSNALVQNIATGCTMVINGAALSKIVPTLPTRCVMHDWWIYLVVSAFGTVVYDPQPSMQYRQHNQNLMGIAFSIRTKFKQRITRMYANDLTKPLEQLLEFERLFGNQLDADKRKILHQLVAAKDNFLPRISILFSRKFHRQSLMDDMLIRFAMLIGKF